MLTEKKKDAIKKLNARNHYGISYETLLRLTREHRKACKENDIDKMEAIEYRLTDINFHHECGMLCEGQYDELLKEIKAEMN